MSSSSSSSRVIEWKTRALDIVFGENELGVICLRNVVPHGAPRREGVSALFATSSLPLVSLRLVGEGNGVTKTAKSLVGSSISERLRYDGHETSTVGDLQTLRISSVDTATHIRVTTHLTVNGDIPVIRSSSSITNTSKTDDVIVTQLSSLVIGGLTSDSSEWYHDYTVMTATNGWFREAQWREDSLSRLGIDNNGICELPEGHVASQGTFELSNRTSFSTGSYLPMGILKSTRGNHCWLWQIEHSGSWKWEIGDFKDSIYLAMGGPTSKDHGWKHLLKCGETFESVPVSLAYVSGTIDHAFGALTNYRRKIRRPHTDNERLPIIFNDYMNCLMGDPDENKIKALLDPVVRSGAEYFVIDAGWYADDSNWWDDVGLWEPSPKRFPSGFKQLLDHIRSKGLIPGLWVEPEVVGVRSVVADRLPADAFFQEDGQRIIERGRYQLDYRHPEVLRWMNQVIENLVVNYGAGYFKFDYNIEVTTGSDANAYSTGVAHLDHQRAYLEWVGSLLDRYPDLVIENCSSGGQRMEYGMLSVHPLQSTSDQQDPILYAAIAAAVPTAVAPEQSATWAYPQPEWDDELNALTVINSLLGRVHLSGRLDLLQAHQYDLISEGMQVYQSIRSDLKDAVPVWPLGLPTWHQDWVCLGMLTKKGSIYLSVWRRQGSLNISIPFHQFEANTAVVAKLLYPTRFETKYEWSAITRALDISLPPKVCARLFCLTPPA